MKYKTKSRLKKIWYYILAILTMIVIAIVGAIQGKAFEIITSMVFFFIFSPFYEKQFHCKSLYKCSGVSVIVFAIMSRVTFKIEMSLFFTVALTLALTSLSYFLKEILDKVVLVEYYRKKLEQFNHKCLENLTEDEMQESLPNIPFDIIHIVYGYIHKSKNYTSIAYAKKCNISEATLFRYLKRVKTEYNSLID